jgi:hypothetical protein
MIYFYICDNKCLYVFTYNTFLYMRLQQISEFQYMQQVTSYNKKIIFHYFILQNWLLYLLEPSSPLLGLYKCCI